MKTIPAKVKNLAARLVQKAIAPIYFESVPLSEIFNALTVAGLVPLQEDFTVWSGILCGREGSMLLRVAAKESANGEFFVPSRNTGLFVGWYKMESGKYEVTAYVS